MLSNRTAKRTATAVSSTDTLVYRLHAFDYLKILHPEVALHSESRKHDDLDAIQRPCGASARVLLRALAMDSGRCELTVAG